MRRWPPPTIDVMQALRFAKEHAASLLGVRPATPILEEIERKTYKGREVWSITLSVPMPLGEEVSGARLAAILGKPDRHYKRFLVDAESGELVAMKLREVAAQ